MSGIAGLIKIEELRKRIIFTIAMLALYRLGLHIPTPGGDGAALKPWFEGMQGTIFGICNPSPRWVFALFFLFAFSFYALYLLFDYFPTSDRRGSLFPRPPEGRRAGP